MRKFLQWSLVTIVAIVLLAAVVGQILATSTGRAREASVAVLKEKLARLEAAHGDAVEPAAISDPLVPKSVEEASTQVRSVGEDELRARWLAMFNELDQTWRKCGFESPFPQFVVFEGEGELDAALRQELADYRDCIGPTATALVQLLEESGDLGGLFKISSLPEWADYERFWYCQRLLTMCFWIDTTLKDYSGIVDAYGGNLKLSGEVLANTEPWNFQPTLIWKILDSALGSGVVDSLRWDRLLGVLESQRMKADFLQQVRRETEEVLLAFENWKSHDWGFSFADSPIGYMRTWAYPRLTPALFNHDFDRFNRAMDRLLELADKPYFEVKDDLEQFCIEFDVEPDFQSMKFTRNNPGWRYVLSVSRYGFEENARSQASIDVIRFAILLEKHKRESGSYPESLEVFAEAMGGSLPVNPLVGDAYVYERDGDAFRLGYRNETHPDLVEVGLETTSVTWWHDPLGVEEDFE